MFDVTTLKYSFSCAAPTYDAHTELQKIVRDDCLRLAEGCWGKGAKILDAGSGTGALARSAALLGLGWDVTQMDIAFGMCALSHAVNASADAMPFADGCFDGVFSSLMLQWVNDPLKVLREMARVTRPGGRCILSTFTHGTLTELRESFAVIDDAPHVSDFTEPAALTTLAAHAGFALLYAHEEAFLRQYADVLELMRSLKTIGAGNKHSGRNRGLMTPRKLAQLEQHYRKQFGKKKTIPATWQVMTMILEKRP